MFTSPNFKMTFSLAIVSNTAITTLKFINNVGAKMEQNVVLKFKKATQLIFGLKNNFYITLW